MNEWLPIKTAPKDGNKVDLWCRRYNGRPLRVIDMYWQDNFGWRDEAKNSFNSELARNATHWMFPPEPPEVDYE